MPIAWGEHLDIARAVETLGEHDITAGFVAMSGSLHLLQRDLQIDLIFRPSPADLAGVTASASSFSKL